MTYHVYIIEGKNGWKYCGFTANIIKRLQAHNKGKCISTRRNKPYVIKMITEQPTRMWARIIEKSIKNFGVNRYWNKYRFSPQKKISDKIISEINNPGL